jgi:hypothetical protein
LVRRFWGELRKVRGYQITEWCLLRVTSRGVADFAGAAPQFKSNLIISTEHDKAIIASAITKESSHETAMTLTYHHH